MATAATAARLDGRRPPPRRHGWTDGDQHHGGTAGRMATSTTAARLDGWRPAPRRRGWTDGDQHHGR